MPNDPSSHTLSPNYADESGTRKLVSPSIEQTEGAAHLGQTHPGELLAEAVGLSLSRHVAQHRNAHHGRLDLRRGHQQDLSEPGGEVGMDVGGRGNMVERQNDSSLFSHFYS